MDPALTALTSPKVTTVAQLLATVAWEQATSAVGGLRRRVHPERGQTVHAALPDSRPEVLAARQVGDKQVERALVGKSRAQLRRCVAADPQAADDLRRVVTKMRPALADTDPRQDATIIMQATTFDTSRVNQAGRDLHLTTGE
jgi:predicted LPLAT superfamily acyltransferase